MGPGPLKWLWVGELLTWEGPPRGCSVPHSPLTYKDTEVKQQVTCRRSGSRWGQYPVPWHPSQGLLLKPHSGWENNDTHSNTSKLKLICPLTKSQNNHMALLQPCLSGLSNSKDKCTLSFGQAQSSSSRWSLFHCNFPPSRYVQCAKVLQMSVTDDEVYWMLWAIKHR